MDMEAGDGKRYFESLHGPDGHEVGPGGRRMIVVTVELHDVDDVNDLIEMLQTFNERLIA